MDPLPLIIVVINDTSASGRMDCRERPRTLLKNTWVKAQALHEHLEPLIMLGLNVPTLNHALLVTLLGCDLAELALSVQDTSFSFFYIVFLLFKR